MINPNELRIGNILNCGIDEDDKGNEIPMPGRILQLFETVFHWTPNLKQQSTREGYNATDYKYVEGTPLTTEWLINSCFEYNKGEFKLSIGHCMLSFNMAKAVGELTCEGYSIRQFKYVHQLQNLYFALTGEELQIKMP